MAGSDEKSECYEGASRLEHDVALQLIRTGAALAAAVCSVAARVRRAFKRSAGPAHRQSADGVHRYARRST
jgi:hypothetical protein